MNKGTGTTIDGTDSNRQLNIKTTQLVNMTAQAVTEQTGRLAAEAIALADTYGSAIPIDPDFITIDGHVYQGKNVENGNVLVVINNLTNPPLHDGSRTVYPDSNGVICFILSNGYIIGNGYDGINDEEGNPIHLP